MTTKSENLTYKQILNFLRKRNIQTTIVKPLTDAGRTFLNSKSLQMHTHKLTSMLSCLYLKENGSLKYISLCMYIGVDEVYWVKWVTYLAANNK